MEQSKHSIITSDSKNGLEGIRSLSYSGTTTLVASPTSPVNAKPPRAADRHYWRVASAFLCFFAVGWGDASTGVLMPDIQIDFQLNYIMGSMLFMAGSVSYALATFIVQPTAHLLGRYTVSSEHRNIFPLLRSNPQETASSSSKGRHLSLFFSGLLHCAYFLIAACSPQYPGVLAGFFIGGVGKSILIAQINVFWTTNPRLNGIALLHGVYGVGAFLSPLVSQTLRARGYTWREFFWISLGLAVCNVAFSLFAFQTTQEEFKIEKHLALASRALCRATDKNMNDRETGSPGPSQSCGNDVPVLRILAMPYVWTIAVFLGVYQGAETIAQGFIVTFLLHERNADPDSVGYVASGFWAGLAVGRVVWGFLSPRFSQKQKIFYVNFVLGTVSCLLLPAFPLICLLVLAMGFHVLIWRVDSLTVDAVIVSLLGLLAGPTFPLILDIATNPNTKQTPGTPSLLPVLPPEVQLTALATGSSVGAIGGAIFSLSAGVAANTYGAFVVEPLALGTVGFVFCFWICAQVTFKLVRRTSLCTATV